MLTFNADEVLAIAVRIEQNGNRFYTQAARQVKDAAAKELFEGLAVLELSHEKTFSVMRTELSNQARTATTFDPDGQTRDYLLALADNRVFDTQSDPVARLAGQESPRDIIKMAIGMEKDSIILYLGMRDMVPPQFGRDKIDAIIREEMRHITVLSRELATQK